MSPQSVTHRRRVVVTGMGVVAANASNLEEFRSALQTGTNGIKPVESFSTNGYLNNCAGVIPDGCARGNKDETALDRAEYLALLASREAIQDAAIQFTEELGRRAAVTLGTSLGGWNTYIDVLRDDVVLGPSGLDEQAYRVISKVPPCRVAETISAEFGITGGTATTVTACAAGANSIAAGVDRIRNGRADVVLSVATDPLSELPFSGFSILQALSRSTCKPFDRERGGLIIGEGAAALVLEEHDAAVRRGARIYCEFSGYGLSSDAFHATQPDPAAGGACRAIRRAFADANVSPADIDYINAHGTATKHNDAMELKAISEVYAERAADIPVSSIKAMIGHTLGAAGTIEAAATILALYHQFLPPTINFSQPVEGYNYDFVPVSRQIDDPRYMASHSFGFGGNAVCLLFGKYSEGDLAVSA